MRRLVSLSFISMLLLVVHATAQRSWERMGGPQDGDINVLMRDSSGDVYAMHSNSTTRFRSSDNGRTWIRMDEIVNTPPHESQSATATRDGALYFIGRYANSLYGLYRSSDKGATWKMTRSEGAGQLVASTPDGLVLFAYGEHLERYGKDDTLWKDISIVSHSGIDSDGTVQSVAGAVGSILYAGTLSGVYRSSDDGDSWTYVSEGIGSRPIQSIVIGTDGELYAVGDTLVYRSTNNGEQWEQLSITVGTSPSIAVADNGTVIVSSMADTLHRSTDHGMTWSQMVVTGLHTRSLLVAEDGTWLAGSAYNGLFQSADDGLTWRISNTGMDGGYVESLAITPEGRIYAGIRGGYGGIIYTSTDRGRTWEGLRPDPAPTPIWCLCVLPNGYVIAGTEGSGILRSTDQGKTWMQENDGLANLFVRSLLALPGGDVLAGTERGIYRSTDDGETWSLAATSTTISQFWALARHPDGTLLGGASNGPVFYSTDGGVTWTMVSKFGATSDIQSLSVAPDGSVYAASFNTGTFRSTDVGRTWTKVLDSKSAAMAVLAAPDGVVYVGGNGAGGINKSTDNGATWNADTSEIGRKFVNVFAMDSSGYLYAGSAGFGLLRSLTSKLSVSTRQDNERNLLMISALDIVPNVITSSATIRFTLKQRNHVDIRLYSQDGEEQSRVLNQNLDDGNYSIECAMQHLASGTYHCVVNVGGDVFTRQFIVVH